MYQQQQQRQTHLDDAIRLLRQYVRVYGSVTNNSGFWI
jgi:hypothetical protein